MMRFMTHDQQSVNDEYAAYAAKQYGIPVSTPRKAPKRKLRAAQKWMIAGVTVAVLGLGLTGLAKVLHPGTTDGRFASTTHTLIPGKSDKELIALGHRVCDTLSTVTGSTPVALALAAQNGIAALDAASFVGDSVAAYCPSKRALLN